MYGSNACCHGCRFNFLSKEGEAERRSHDQHWLEEDVRQGEEVFIPIHGNRLHRHHRSLRQPSSPDFLDALVSILRLLRVYFDT